MRKHSLTAAADRLNISLPKCPALFKLLLPTSFLQFPSTTFPAPFSVSVNPEGQYTADSVVRKKLCNAMAALVNMTAFSGVVIMGLLKIRHLAARMPKLFSITLLHQLRQ